MSKIRILGLALILATPASSPYAQNILDGDGGIPSEYSIEMTEGNMASGQACQNKDLGAACSFQDPVSNTLFSGTCKKIENTVGYGTEFDSIMCQ